MYFKCSGYSYLFINVRVQQKKGFSTVLDTQSIPSVRTFWHISIVEDSNPNGKIMACIDKTTSIIRA